MYSRPQTVRITVTDLLISIRNVKEAQTILNIVPELAILDIKEPRLGALSATSPETWLNVVALDRGCLLYTSPSPRDATLSRMPSSA